MKIVYPATVKPQKPSGYFVRFADLPEAITQGDSVEEALANASEALSLVLDHYLETGREIPRPSRARKGQRLVAPDAKTQGALLVRWARGDRSLADLARNLETSWPAAARLEDPRHSPSLRNLERAASALGKRLVISFE